MRRIDTLAASLCGRFVFGRHNKNANEGSIPVISAMMDIKLSQVNPD